MTPYYRVGTWKLAVLSLCTFGLYGVYWHYKQWMAENEIRKVKVSAGVYAFFAVFTAYSLFSSIKATLESDGDQPGFSPGLFAAAYAVLVISWRLPGALGLIGFLWFIPIVPIQRAINLNARKHDPYADLNENWEWWAFLLTAMGTVLLLLAIVGALFPELAEAP